MSSGSTALIVHPDQAQAEMRRKPGTFSAARRERQAIATWKGIGRPQSPQALQVACVCSGTVRSRHGNATMGGQQLSSQVSSIFF